MDLAPYYEGSLLPTTKNPGVASPLKKRRKRCQKEITEKRKRVPI